MVQTNPVVIQANPPQQLSQQSFLQGNVSNTNNMNVNSGGVQKMQHQQQQILQQPQQHQTQQQHILTYQTSYDPMAMQSTTNKNPAQYLTQKSEDPMLSQIKIERDIMLSQVVNVNEQMAPDTAVDVPMPIEEPAKEAVVAGTQKTAEKMRKDEGMFRDFLLYIRTDCMTWYKLVFFRFRRNGHNIGRLICQHSTSGIETFVPQLE